MEDRRQHETRPHEPPEVSDPGGIRGREALRQDAMGAAAWATWWLRACAHCSRRRMMAHKRRTDPTYEWPWKRGQVRRN